MSDLSEVERTPSAPVVAGRVGVVGLGLMGGSFAKAFHDADTETYVWNRTRSTLDFALIESATGELTDEVIPTCELIVLTTYPEHLVEWLREHAELVSPSTIVIDTAGVKRAVCSELWPLARTHGFTFVGCHPMAGTQYSGFAHSRATMFRKAPMVVCADPEMDEIDRLWTLDRLTKLLEPLGFGSYTMASPTEHDEIIAYTSQLAHVVSNAYVKSPRALVHKGFSAGSYLDLTRVARLNAAMWAELFMDDADNLVAEIDGLRAHLGAYADALRAGDRDRLQELLAEGDRAKREAEGR